MENVEPIVDTLERACARLSISRSLAYTEIKAGRLIALKARGRTLITREAQAQYLAALPTVGQPAGRKAA